MKALLGKFAARKAWGLYVGDDRLTLSQVAFTVLGPVELSRRSEPYQPDQLGEALGRLLPLAARRFGRQALLAAGVPTLRVFFSTRPIRTAKKDASAQALLHEVFQSPTIAIDDMAVDVIQTQPGHRKVASIVSCRKKYLAGLLAALAGFPRRAGDRPVRLVRVQPAPCALLRAAAHLHPTPRRARTLLRVFLGASQGLAAAVTHGMPIVWRAFPLPAGAELDAVRTVVRSIQALLGHCGIETGLDLICLHGRPDLHAAAKGELEPGLEIRVQATDGPALDDDSIAFGLALGAFDGPDTFDLARELKPLPALRDIFPWGELAVQGALLVCLALTLGSRYLSREDRLETLQAEAGRHTSRDAAPESELLREKKDLEQKVEAVRRCLSTRVLWTAYTHDIAARLPPGVTLTSFHGQAELEDSSPKKEGGKGARGRRALVLKGSAPIGPRGSTPPEIDTLLDALRADPLLRRDFPAVELADVRWIQGTERAKPAVSFTILCLPEKDRRGAGLSGKK